MQEKERQWRARVEASIESKDARSRMIQREREAAKKHVRRYMCHYCTVAPPPPPQHTRTLVVVVVVVTTSRLAAGCYSCAVWTALTVAAAAH